MPTDKQEAVKRFLNDPEMVKAVHNVLRFQFLKPPKERDIQYLAASWLAKDLFEEAWKVLLRYKSENKDEAKDSGQIGL